MKWPLPLLLAYVLLALEPPVREFLKLGPASPSLVFPLIVFIALLGSSTAALWTALLIGLVVDLTTLRGTGVGGAIIIAGPHALGYTAAAYLILTLRPIVMRKNPITLVALSVVGEALAALVVVSVFALRRMLYHGAWADALPGALLPDLWQRCIGACYTGVAALVLAALLFPLIPWFGFQDPSIRRSFARRY
jgi:cell shape-determining protein MreD